MTARHTGETGGVSTTSYKEAVTGKLSIAPIQSCDWLIAEFPERACN